MNWSQMDNFSLPNFYFWYFRACYCKILHTVLNLNSYANEKFNLAILALDFEIHPELKFIQNLWVSLKLPTLVCEVSISEIAELAINEFLPKI